jgi:hypothetical protein
MEEGRKTLEESGCQKRRKLNWDFVEETMKN